MIIEFCGLPGSGKSTLEKNLLLALKTLNHPVLMRGEAIKYYIQDKFWSQYNQDTYFRKAFTAAYQSQLIFDLITTQKYRPKLGPGFIHLTRSSLRQAEADRISEWCKTKRPQNEILNLSEGIFQHAISKQVWQNILQNIPLDKNLKPVDSEQSQNSNHTVIYVSVPANVAYTRLIERGQSSNWPRHKTPKSIIETYSAIFSEVFTNEKPNHSSFRILTVDGTIPMDEWPHLAKDLAETIK